MKRFVFDLDETLVRGDIITVASRQLIAEGKIDRLYTGRDVTNWKMDGVPEAVSKRAVELFSNVDYAVWQKEPIAGVISFLNYLHSMGHKICILTARPMECHADTYDYVDDTFPNIIENVICVKSGPNGSKLPDLAKLNPTYYFDDNLTFCEEARLLGASTYLVSNEHTPWNHYVVHHEIQRIKNVCFFPNQFL